MNEIKCPKCGEVFQIDETSYEKIATQIRDKEFEKRIKEREKQFETEKQSAIESTTLNHRIEIQKLNGIIEKNETEKKLAIEEALKQKDGELNQREREIDSLQSRLQLSKQEMEIKEAEIKKNYEGLLKMKDEQIAQYKDFKAKQSVKLLGESLEQHCQIAFDKVRSIGFQNAYFEKDNDARTGSKGDYIFRLNDDDGTEILSIMFEMKNEGDTTATKKKNEDFFKELDKDRNEKKCEYAVLVTMLELDNEFYNDGIVDVSHRYNKMYVVRPNFFIPIITILRNVALNSLEYKRALVLAQHQNIDITNFEQELAQFKTDLSGNISRAQGRFGNAIDEIDKTIKHLEKVKEELLGSSKQLSIANSKAEDLTIKKLTKNSPSLRLEFENIKKNK